MENAFQLSRRLLKKEIFISRNQSLHPALFDLSTARLSQHHTVGYTPAVQCPLCEVPKFSNPTRLQNCSSVVHTLHRDPLRTETIDL